MKITGLILITISLIHDIKGNCDPLIKRKGITVRCELPNGSSQGCYSGKIATGSIAKYKCNQYYTPAHDDFSKFGGTLTCNSRGTWSNRIAFLQYSCVINCGISPLEVPVAIGFVIGGHVTEREHWPWHASIFSKKNVNDKFRYICGGTLLNPYGIGYIILTAAHCLADSKDSPRDPKLFKILLGSEYSVYEDNNGIRDVQIHNVKKILLHKSYAGGRNDYQSDIAIILLEDDVKLSNVVVPVCFNEKYELANVGSLGNVTGFGRYDRTSEATSIRPKYVTLPVVNQQYCQEWRDRKLSAQEICAGYIGESQSTCNGDSGGGYVFKRKQPEKLSRYYIQGIVSHGRREGSAGNIATCDHYSVFTKVNSYANWIKDETEKAYNGEFDSMTIQQKPKKTTTESSKTDDFDSEAVFAAAKPKPVVTAQHSNVELVSASTVSPSSTGTVSVVTSIPNVPTESFNSFDYASLERHNYYRQMHSAPPFKLNQALKQRAQDYAEKLLRENILVNLNEEDISKNLYSQSGAVNSVQDKELTVIKAVNFWYEDANLYTHTYPIPSTFTQLVWKSSTEMGTGIASNSRKTIVVTAYAPPGNVVGQFHENVSL